MSKLLWVLAPIWYLIFAASSISAAGEFYAKHVVNYKFDALGNSTVEQNISLTNKVPQIYASQYTLTIQGDVPKNITGHDSSGPLKIAVDKTGETATVSILFNDRVVGLNQTLNFTLSYQSQPATHNGQVWEVVLPKLGNPENINDYELNLLVPPSFGKLAFISPSPAASDDYRYTFTKDQISKIGVIAAFGNFQTFGFKLDYHLENPTRRPGLTTIALPPDTNYQRVFYDSLDPLPQSVEADFDGNWLATYRLEPGQQLVATASGQVHILAEPTYNTLPTTDEQLRTYLQPTSYWPSSDPQIRVLAAKLRTPKAIYDYVVSTLSYDYSRARPGITRKGGKLALDTPDSSICTEFTDAFITLARAAGIPAREHQGFAYTSDSQLRPLSLVSDVLHAWPQYWDWAKRTWISIDPTWGKTTGGIDYFTKLDFNHFTFVIHGLSDSEPFPAGSYKTDPKTRDVDVYFAQYQDYSAPEIKLTWNPPWQILPFVATPSTLTLANPSGQAIYRLPVDITPRNLRLLSPQSAAISLLPPFSRTQIPVVFAPHTRPTFTPKALLVAAGASSMTYNIPSLLFLGWQTVLGLIIAALIIVAGFIFAHFLHYRRRRLT